MGQKGAKMGRALCILCVKLELLRAGIYRRRGFVLLRRAVLRRFEDFVGFFAAASSRRRAFAQPSLLTCRPRASASASAGTFSVITEPAATYAPSPTRTGATSAVSLPMKTPLPIFVSYFATPS